jgi:nitrous oxidase accessory protein NosD
MLRRVLVLVVSVLAIVLVGCPTKPGVTWSVDAVSGSDTNDGTTESPFKTISQACEVAVNGDIITVAPGTYDAALGETFPIAIPAGVTIVGDEANQGDGAIPTLVQGGGAVKGDADTNATLLPGAGATVTGLKIVDNASVMFPMGVFIAASGVTLSSSTVSGCSSAAVYVTQGASTAVITDNRITGNTFGVGVVFFLGGDGSKLQDNYISANEIGVEYDDIAGDMGGGMSGSKGGNKVFGNARVDLWTSSAGVAISARNCYWDHVPPTVGADGGGTDIYNRNSISIDVTGAKQAP